MGFKVAAIFSDNMVLQRNKRICVFGEGNTNDTVIVSFMGQNVTGTVKDGIWKIYLNPCKEAENQVMQVSCGEQITVFKNIAVGEVFLAGGQSNMEYELINADGGVEELANAKDGEAEFRRHDDVRFYYVQKKSYIDEEFLKEESRTTWECFGKNAARWSAVGYFFAKELAERLGVTVGVIGCNWGGTSALCWMDSEVIRADKATAVCYEEYLEAISGKSIEEQIREYDEYTKYADAWSKRAEQCYADNPRISWEEVLEICGESRWPGPVSCKSPFRPSGLYECMLKRVAPYTLAGVLYYQGEEDEKRAGLYETLLKNLIGNFRRDFEDRELPFMIVQLPVHKYSADEDLKSWPVIRQAQYNVFRTIKNTGLAVIADCGELNEIHPHNKKTPAHRLYLQALHTIYGLISEEEALGAVYTGHKIEGNRMCLEFKNSGTGFVTGGLLCNKKEHEADADIMNDACNLYFEVAGEDKVYYEAKAEIEGNTIAVYADEVPEPLYVRYGWYNYFDRFIYGDNGLPLMPFTSEPYTDMAEVKGYAGVQQIMEL